MSSTYELTFVFDWTLLGAGLSASWASEEDHQRPLPAPVFGAVSGPVSILDLD